MTTGVNVHVTNIFLTGCKSLANREMGMGWGFCDLLLGIGKTGFYLHFDDLHIVC